MIAIAIFCLLSAILLVAMTLHAELSQEEMAKAKGKFATRVDVLCGFEVESRR